MYLTEAEFDLLARAAVETVIAERTDLKTLGRCSPEAAEGVGYKQNTISVYRQAATVFKKVSDIGYFQNSRVSDKDTLLSKTNHLVEIYQANEDCWKILVDLLLSKGWTVQDTRKKVKRANEFEQRAINLGGGRLVNIRDADKPALWLLAGQLRAAGLPIPRLLRDKLAAAPGPQAA